MFGVPQQLRRTQRHCLGAFCLLDAISAALDEAASWIAAQRATWTRRLDALEGLIEPQPLDGKSKREHTLTRKLVPCNCGS